MVNITRFNPLGNTLDNLLRVGGSVWLPDPEARAPAPMKFRMDVVENDREYQGTGGIARRQEGRDQHHYQRQ